MNHCYLPFNEAREFVRNLGLKNRAEWRLWTLSKCRPSDIPYCPSRVYRDQWESFADWLRPNGQPDELASPRELDGGQRKKRNVIAWGLNNTAHIKHKRAVGVVEASIRKIQGGASSPPSSSQNLPQLPSPRPSPRGSSDSRGSEWLRGWRDAVLEEQPELLELEQVRVTMAVTHLVTQSVTRLCLL